MGPHFLINDCSHLPFLKASSEHLFNSLYQPHNTNIAYYSSVVPSQVRLPLNNAITLDRDAETNETRKGVILGVKHLSLLLNTINPLSVPLDFPLPGNLGQSLNQGQFYLEHVIFNPEDSEPATPKCFDDLPSLKKEWGNMLRKLSKHINRWMWIQCIQGQLCVWDAEETPPSAKDLLSISEITKRLIYSFCSNPLPGRPCTYGPVTEQF